MDNSASVLRKSLVSLHYVLLVLHGFKRILGGYSYIHSNEL